MAESKSTIVKVLGTTAGSVLKWSSIASGANNVYVDVRGVDASKIIFLIAKSSATKAIATAGYFYFGSSASASTGSSDQFSARRLGRFRVKIPTGIGRASSKEALNGTAGSKDVAIAAYGPYETARLKTTAGYIKVSKAAGAGDAGTYKIAPILLP